MQGGGIAATGISMASEVEENHSLRDGPTSNKFLYTYQSGQ
jgi:hypothetical protein